MKLCGMSALPCGGRLSQGFDRNVAEIRGDVVKLGQGYRRAQLILVDRSTFMPVAATMPVNGHYVFRNVDPEKEFMVVCTLIDVETNAKIYDRVRAK